MKKTTAALIFASAALVLGACSKSFDRVRYTYEPAGQLCFAEFRRGDLRVGWTNVPCTKKVLEQIAKDSPNGIARFPNEVFNEAQRGDGLRP